MFSVGLTVLDFSTGVVMLHLYFTSLIEICVLAFKSLCELWFLNICMLLPKWWLCLLFEASPCQMMNFPYSASQTTGTTFSAILKTSPFFGRKTN